MISFIVSVYDRTDMLGGCLETLAVQDDPKQLIVTMNGTKEQNHKIIERTKGHNAIWSHTGLSGAKNCYEAALMAIETRGPMGKPMNLVKGDWLCFPSDDSLYVQGFSRIMLQTANLHAADLVYCDCVYRQDKAAGNWPEYTTLETEPRMGRIDKTCFILRRELFKGFPQHPKGWSDGALIEQLIAQGVRHAKAPGILVVHQ